MTNDPKTNRPVSAPKWHRLYYALAGVNLVVIILGLSLGYQRVSLADKSTSETLEWNRRMEDYAKLGELAADVNAPGNDVFENGDFKNESKRMELALAKFNQALTKHEQHLTDAPGKIADPLRMKLNAVRVAMVKMTEESRTIFGYFSERREDLAGPRMAEMDRKYRTLDDSIGALSGSVMEYQTQLLEDEAKGVSVVRQIEYIISGCVVLLVGLAIYYGRKTKQKIDESVREREIYLAELESADVRLRESWDAMERKVAERTLELSEQKDYVENLFNSMVDMVLVTDDKGRILRVNDSTCCILGYSEEELVGESIGILVGNDTLLTEDELELMDEKREIKEVEKELIRKNGDQFPVMISASLLNSKVFACVVVGKDITNFKRDEQRLIDYTVKLEQSNRELEEFAYVASHDLQEPLRKIQAFGDRLERKYAGQLPEEGHDYIKRMGDAAKRMQRLINDLLTFSRVATKAQPFVNVDVNQITNEVISDLEVRIEETGGIVELGSLPEIDADPSQMRQLMQNLIGNALKFKQAGQAPRIKVYSPESSNTSPLVTEGRAETTGLAMSQIVVQDNGIGFDEKYLDRIFTVFQRLHGRSEYEGSGVGLAVCRKIVERHRGTITATSSEGNGAKFIINLPTRQI